MRRPRLAHSLMFTAFVAGARPASASDVDCDDFFERVRADWEVPGESYGWRIIDEGESFGAAWAEAHTYAESMGSGFAVLALLQNPGPTYPMESLTMAPGLRIAFCSEATYDPPPLVVPEGASLALANAKWNDPEQRGVETPPTAFIDNAGGILVIESSTLESSAIEDGEPTALVRLHGDAAGARLAGVTITGEAVPNLSLVRHERPGWDRCFSGRVDLDRISWDTIGADSAAYRPVCPSDDDLDEGCTWTLQCPDQTVTVTAATFGGAGDPPELSDYFIRSVGGLTVTGSVFQDLNFNDVSALKAAGDLRIDGGTSLLEVRGQSSAEPQPLAASLAGDLIANTVLAADVSGWGGLFAGQDTVRLEQSYICGIDDAQSLLQQSNLLGEEVPDARIAAISTAVVGSRFSEGLIRGEEAGATAGQLFNLLLLNTARDDDAPLTLVSGEGDTAADLTLVNVLATDSQFAAGNVGTVTADAVRVYGDHDCVAAGLEGDRVDCAELSASPEFRSGMLLRDPANPTCGFDASSDHGFADLAALMRAEAAVDRGDDGQREDLQDLTLRLRETLAALFENQDDLVGAGSPWSTSWSDCASATGGDADDIGAYGGTCSLSFLEPSGNLNTPDEMPGDTGEPQDAARARFGLGSGCRYGSAALLLPLAVAIRRRRRANRT